MIADSFEAIEAQLREALLDNARLRKMLAAYDPAADARPASAVTPRGDDRRSWLALRLRAGGLKTRDAAGRILTHVTNLPENERADVVEALHEMIDETDRWQNAWSASTVDHDHKLRDAMARSELCSAHGEEIRYLRASAWHWSQVAERNEKARLIMLGWYQACQDFLQAATTRGVAGLPDAPRIIRWMKDSLPKVSRAHQRVFNKDLPKPPADPKEAS